MDWNEDVIEGLLGEGQTPLKRVHFDQFTYCISLQAKLRAQDAAEAPLSWVTAAARPLLDTKQACQLISRCEDVCILQMACLIGVEGR